MVTRNVDQSRMLSMQQTDLRFGEGAGVFDLNLTVPAGTIMGMIGPSGCGKTTAVRLLTGVYHPTAGQVTVLGMAPTRFGAAERERIGYIPQHFVLYPNLTVSENLHFVSSLYGMRRSARRRRMDELLEFVELTEARDRLAHQLSGGMQRRLMLAGALMHKPELLFADEPTAGIDPVLRRRFWDYFRQLRDQGCTLLVTTQYVGEAASCDQVTVMRKGRLVTVDTPEGLRRQALDGEVIVLEVEPRRAWEVIQFVERQPGVRDAEPVRGQRNLIHVAVDDAAQQLPVLLEAIKTGLDITPQRAEPYLPPFDDVFVALMQKAEARDA
jgi:ABC-2 type transport system ATP-binding protein